jgi:hypothetical protein
MPKRIVLQQPEVTPEVRVTELRLHGAAFTLDPPLLMIYTRTNIGDVREQRIEGASALTTLQALNAAGIEQMLLQLLQQQGVAGTLEDVPS